MHLCFTVTDYVMGVISLEIVKPVPSLYYNFFLLGIHILFYLCLRMHANTWNYEDNFGTFYKEN